MINDPSLEQQVQWTSVQCSDTNCLISTFGGGGDGKQQMLSSRSHFRKAENRKFPAAVVVKFEMQVHTFVVVN